MGSGYIPLDKNADASEHAKRVAAGAWVAANKEMLAALKESLEAWEGEKHSVKEEHAELIEKLQIVCEKADAPHLIEQFSDDLKRKGIDPSWHITGNHPVRECVPLDRGFDPCWIVRFPRGFGELQVAVWGDQLNESDVCESALEWMGVKHPAAVADDDEENCFASRLKRQDARALQALGAPVAEPIFQYSITGRLPDCDNEVWIGQAPSAEAALRLFAEFLYVDAAEVDNPKATYEQHQAIMYVESMVTIRSRDGSASLLVLPPDQIDASLENVTATMLTEAEGKKAAEDDDLPSESAPQRPKTK